MVLNSLREYSLKVMIKRIVVESGKIEREKRGLYELKKVRKIRQSESKFTLYMISEMDLM